MKTLSNKAVIVLLIVIAGLLLANLATMLMQQAEVRSQTVGQGQLTVVPLASGQFAAAAPPGCPAPGCFWSMYVILAPTGTPGVVGGAPAREACFISYNPGTDTMTHRCSSNWIYQGPGPR